MADAYREVPAERTCLRCHVEVVPVNAVDRGGPKLYVGLAYTTERAPEASLWSGAMTNATGVLRAYVCPKCQLVAWYAHPGEPVD